VKLNKTRNVSQITKGYRPSRTTNYPPLKWFGPELSPSYTLSGC